MCKAHTSLFVSHGTGLELPGSFAHHLPRDKGDCHRAGGDGLVAECTDLDPPHSVFLDPCPLSRAEQDGHCPGEFLVSPSLFPGNLRQLRGICIVSLTNLSLRSALAVFRSSCNSAPVPPILPLATEPKTIKQKRQKEGQCSHLPLPQEVHLLFVLLLREARRSP